MFLKFFGKKSENNDQSSESAGGLIHGIDREMNYCPSCGDEYRAGALYLRLGHLLRIPKISDSGGGYDRSLGYRDPDLGEYYYVDELFIGAAVFEGEGDS